MPEILNINDQSFYLTPSGAAYWKEQEALLIADVHLGKSRHFRKKGLGVPLTADDKEYQKMNDLIAVLQPKRLWFLGDLFHSYKNAEWELFKRWTQSFKDLKITLIIGNHDKIAIEQFEQLQIQTTEELLIDEFYLTHIPTEREDHINIAGHIHPGIRMRGAGKQHVKLSCFYFKDNQFILPAFGDFTGNYIITPSKSDTVYALADDQVICVSS